MRAGVAKRMGRGPLFSDEPFVDRRKRQRPLGAEPWSSVRRDAWRVQALAMQVAEEVRERREAKRWRRTILVGIALGLVIGVAMLVF